MFSVRCTETDSVNCMGPTQSRCDLISCLRLGKKPTIDEQQKNDRKQGTLKRLGALSIVNEVASIGLFVPFIFLRAN